VFQELWAGPSGYDFLGHCDQNVAKNMNHIFNGCCVMIDLIYAKTIQ
jgi:hypothetical protein